MNPVVPGFPHYMSLLGQQTQYKASCSGVNQDQVASVASPLSVAVAVAEFLSPWK